MDEHELSRRLSDAAAPPTRPVDLTAIEAGIARRRRTRRAVVGSVAASVLLVASLATFALIEGDDTRDVIVGTESTTTTTTDGSAENRTRSTFSGEWASYVPAQPPVGVVIEIDSGLSFLDLEWGSEFWAPDMGFADLAEVSGLASMVSSRIPQSTEGEIRWWDPHAGGWSAHAGLGAPLAYGGWAGGPTGFLTDVGDQVLVEGAAANWWLSHDMRVVSWTACESGCGYESYDSLTRATEMLPSGCWVAAAQGDDRVLICDDGETVIIGGERVEVGETMGGDSARAVAAWPNGMVWLDHGRCHASEALYIVDGEVRSLLAEYRASAPSSIPLAMAPDGRAIVHLNAAACDAMDPDPGVYLIDMETRERERVWAGAALPGDVRAWWPAPPRPWVIPDGTTEIEPAELAGRYVTFGQEGVGVVVDGAVDWWWTEGPVRRAFSDGEDGVVFQEVGIPGEGAPGVSGAIWWMGAGGEAERILVPGGEEAFPVSDNSDLVHVGLFDGVPTVFLLRTTYTEPGDVHTGTSSLHALDLGSGRERNLGVVGEGPESGIDGLAISSGSLVLSRCHMQCSLWAGLGGEATRLDISEWRTGLDAAGDLIATVEFDWDYSGPYHDPALTLRDFAGQLVRRVSLPYDPEGGVWSWLDLADDGRSALVVTGLHIPQEPDHFQVVLVTGLDTESPEVQIVHIDHALRFG